MNFANVGNVVTYCHRNKVTVTKAALNKEEVWVGQSPLLPSPCPRLGFYLPSRCWYNGTIQPMKPSERNKKPPLSRAQSYTAVVISVAAYIAMRLYIDAWIALVVAAFGVLPLVLLAIYRLSHWRQRRDGTPQDQSPP